MTMGSSPLTRGKQALGCDVPCGRGLIPTHAGKTTPGHSSSAGPRAHPHSRGENSRRARASCGRLGSSPLTRGKPPLDGEMGEVLGLIPTHAGKTRPPVRTVRRERAHPHSRGENAVLGIISMHENGSSPLTRGKLHTGDERPSHPGLIPTHAGKTLSQPLRALRRTAHPHSRGENSDRAVPEGPERGSSPLTRGKLPAPGRQLTSHGLIPTHAGKTT